MNLKSGLTKFISISLLLLLASGYGSQPKRDAEDLKTAEEQKNPVHFLNMEPLFMALDSFRTQRCVDSAAIAWLIIDDTEDRPYILAEYHADRLLIPASVQKLLVTGAALEILGQGVIKDVTVTNLNSNNWMANKLLRRIGEAVGHEKSLESGCTAIRQFWQGKGIDLTGASLVDGSGRRYDNSLTARQITDILYYQTKAPTFGSFYSSLPLSGISGTMKSMLDGTIGQGRVRAKTGTLAAVKSLAGYASTTSGRRLIFAIIVNNYTCRTSFIKRRMEDILIKMVEL